MTDLIAELRTAAESGPLTFYDSAPAIRELLKRAANALERRYPHWHCDTHGDFDARVAVGCPECVRMMRKQIRILELKAGCSLANNLCPDHRDKQHGKPCLACEIERVERERDRYAEGMRKLVEGEPVAVATAPRRCAKHDVPLVDMVCSRCTAENVRRPRYFDPSGQDGGEQR